MTGARVLQCTIHMLDARIPVVTIAGAKSSANWSGRPRRKFHSGATYPQTPNYLRQACCINRTALCLINGSMYHYHLSFDTTMYSLAVLRTEQRGGIFGLNMFSMWTSHLEPGVSLLLDCAALYFRRSDSFRTSTLSI